MSLKSWENIFEERRKELDNLSHTIALSIYATQNLSAIKAYESMLKAISDKVDQGDLEGLLEISEMASHHKPAKETLTYELYKKARGQGLTNKEIAEKYRLTSRNQIQGLARWYPHKRKKQ